MTSIAVKGNDVAKPKAGADASAKSSDTEASRAMDEISSMADDIRALSRTHLIRLNT